MKITIGKKVAIGFLTTAILPLLVFSLIALRQQSKMIKNYAVNEAKGQAVIIADSLVIEPLMPKPKALFYEPEKLQKFVEDFHKREGRDFVIVDKDRTIIADSVLENIGTTYPHFEQDKEKIEEIISQTVLEGKVDVFREVSADGAFDQTIVPIIAEDEEILGGLIVDYTTTLERYKEYAREEAEYMAKSIAYSLSYVREGTETSALYTTLKDLQLYVEGLHKLEKRDIVVVDTNKQILADVVADNVRATFTRDEGNEVGKTIRDGQTRTFIEESIDYPKGIHQIVVPLITKETKQTVGAVIFEYGNIAEKTTKHVTKNAQTLAQSLALSIATIPPHPKPKALFHEPEKLQKFVEDFHRREGRDFVIVDKDRTVIADSVLENMGTTYPHFEQDKEIIEEIISQTILEGKVGVYREVSADGAFDLVAVPIEIERNERVGAVILEYSDLYANAIRTINNLRITFAITILLISGLIAFFAILFARTIVTPIITLSQTAKAVGRGDLSQKAEVKTKDEIGELADSFNKMTEELQNTTVSRNYMNNIITAMLDTLIVVTPVATIKTVNQATLNLLGYKVDELIGKPVNMILAEEELFKMSGIADLIKKGFISGVEKVYLSKDGRKIPVLFSGSVMRNEQGKVQAIVCVASDITERKRLEESLASEKERLSVTLHSIGDGVIATDNKGNVVMFNKVAQEFTGWILEEASGKPLTEVFHIINEKTREIMDNPVENVLKTGSIVELANHTVLIAREGTERSIADSAAPIINKDGNIIGVVLVFRDVTERKQLEKERQNMELKMIQNSKLASLGEIATGIAHEINQPLTYINSFVFRLKRKLIDDTLNINKDVVLDEAATSIRQIERIGNIINHLRTFGRSDNIEMQQLSIENILNNTFLLMGERIRLKNIEIKTSLEPDMPKIFGSPTKLEQVFINLFQNAIDAFPKRPKNAEINVEMTLSKDKKSIVTKVSDNGMGIREDNLDKIFEPFFTTKEVGAGTGLGLSIVYGIINEHNGTISCESEVNKGSSFTIMLPVVDIQSVEREHKNGKFKLTSESLYFKLQSLRFS